MARTTILNGDEGSDVRARLNRLLQRAVMVMDPVDLSDDLFPETGGSGDLDEVCENDEFPVAVGGSPGGSYIDVGLKIRATADNPGQDIENWTW